MKRLQRSIVAALCSAVATGAVDALACSSCGCSLSSDWASQGYSSGQGLRLDFRYDYFNQNQLRTGTGTVDRGAITFPTDREIQQETVNRNYTVALDYSPNENWGVNVAVPYFDRYHTTVAEGDTELSTSHTTSVGDVRILGRYQGFSPTHNWGIQLGVKLPTGSTDNDFFAGPQAGQPLDRGLQPGTGTTDLLAGLYYFAALSRNWDYFGQALIQVALDSHDDFRPGNGLNANFGVRYVGFDHVTPHVQINIRAESREYGVHADVENSGATLAYISPGVSVHLTNNLNIYGFFQVPIYQRVNGFQIEPRYTVSVGVHYSM
jgi:hypothetical protein